MRLCRLQGQRFLPCFLLVAAAALGGCSPGVKAFEGAVPESEASLIKGYRTICNGSLKISDFDGRYSGTRLRAAPGPHAMSIIYRSRPYWGDDLKTAFSPQCVKMARYQASFTTKPGRTYWFHIDESQPDLSNLTVWESRVLGSVEGKSLEAETKRLSLREVCFIDERYSECLHPGQN